MAGQKSSRRTDSLPDRLPVLPLVNTVVFPSGVAALKLSGKTSRAIVAALDNRVDMIGLFYPEDDSEGEVTAADLLPIGVAARVVQKLQLDDSRQQILCQGICRVELIDVEQSTPYLTGLIRTVDSPVSINELEAAALMGRTIEAYADLAAADDRYRLESVEMLKANSAYGICFFGDLLASLLDAPLEIQRRLIQMTDPVERLRHLLELLEEESERKAVAREVEVQVRERLEGKKREYFLREQLRTIQTELGETHLPSSEAEQFKAMIEDLPIDDESKSILERECDALAVMSPQSPEYPAQSKYLDTVFGLPWWERTKDSLDLRKVGRILGQRHHGMDEVKDRLIEYLSVIKLKGHLSGPILCLAGPPGTGKTTLARSIAAAFGRKFERISLGGISDESEIRGHRKTYLGSMPGKILSAYDHVGSCNPVLLLDEIDKLAKSAQGDPAAALLEVLDPEQNRTYVDRYLGVPFDLSETLFITTANLLDSIPPALRDRLEVLTLSGYTDAEKIEIAGRFMRPKLLEEHGLESTAVRFSKGALESIIRGYTAEAGVRELERQLAGICRKVARQRATHPKEERKPESVRAGHVANYLGPPRYQQEFAGRSPEIGVATGLAWTGEGGAILFIEATRMPGTGNVQVTGHLGEVMLESVRAAYSFVRAHARELEIQPETVSESDVHIHFPAGAIPKDGPSAGIAAATCLASLLSGRPVRHDVAMTGEVTLRGKLLSVGGIKEKLLAAHRARINTVLLPIGNKKDLERIPEVVRDALDIVLVNRVQDVWERALVPLLMADEAEVELFQQTEVDPDPQQLIRPHQAKPKPPR